METQHRTHFRDREREVQRPGCASGMRRELLNDGETAALNVAALLQSGTYDPACELPRRWASTNIEFWCKASRDNSTGAIGLILN